MSASDSRDECTICHENFTKSKPAIVTHCNHRFHRGCILQWFRKQGCHCPVCRRDTSINDSASYGRKKKQSVEKTAGTSEEPRSSATKITTGPSKRKEASESTLRKSTRKKTHTSGGKGLKSSTYEEEELKYVPDWDVCTTDNPSDPLVAQNLAEGLVLPFKAAELAEMPTDFLIQGTYMHCVTALNFVSTSLKRAAEMNGSEEDLKDKILEKDACITELKEQLESAAACIAELKEQLESAAARSATAESRVKEIEAAAAKERTKDIIISNKVIDAIRKELKSAQARAMAAEAALKNIENEVKLKVDEATSKAVEEFKSSQQYKDALVEYAFSSFNEVYSVMKKRAG